MKTENVKCYWDKSQDNEINTDLSKKAIAIKLPVDVDSVFRSVPHMAGWLRRVITEAAQRELMKGDGP